MSGYVDWVNLGLSLLLLGSCVWNVRAMKRDTQRRREYDAICGDVVRELDDAVRVTLQYEKDRYDLLGEEYDRVKQGVVRALDLAVRYGGIDGEHHKAWVIDQMVRALAGDGYDELVRKARAGEDGPETFEWDEGIAP